MSWDKLVHGEDQIFTEQRIRFYATGVLPAYAISMLLWWRLYPNYWIVDTHGHLANIDFCWLWVSGKFAVSSNVQRIYDHASYAAAQNIYFPPGECLYMPQYVYPPNFLFFTYLLGLMPYLTAFLAWVATTIVLYLAAVYAIIARRTAILVALASPAVIKNIQLGHTGFVVAGLFGLSLVFLERRPWIAGIFLGLLTYKPQFGVLFPLALFASRNWRTLAAGAAVAIAFAVAAGFAFGLEGWPSFFASLLDRNAGLSPDEQVELRLQSIYGLLNWAGAGPGVSWAVQLTAGLAVAVTVWLIWAKPIRFSLRASALCIGSVAFTPYVLAYDLCVLSIAAAFLVRDGMTHGFLPGERIVLVLCWAALFLPAIPVAPFIYTTLLLLVFRRIATRPGLDPEEEQKESSFIETKAFAGN